MGILVVMVFLAFMPVNAQLMPEKKVEPVEPVEPKTEPKEKPDAKKYDLKVSYEKGLSFERTFKMNMKNESIGTGEDEYSDTKTTFKLKNTVLAVKDGIPTELKIEFKNIDIEGEMPEQDKSDKEDLLKIVGHWIKVKIGEDGNFGITEKSKDFPKLDDEDNITETAEITLLLFDTFKFPKKSVAVGKSFKFDYNDMLPFEDIVEGLGQITSNFEQKDFMLKLEKVVDIKGTKVAYLAGKIEQSADFYGMKVTFSIKVSIELDISNNKCLKSVFALDFDMSGANPQDGSEIKTAIVLNMDLTNNYGKAVKEEPKVEPKDEE